VGVAPSGSRPYIWNDDDQSLESHIEQIAFDISRGGIIPQAVQKLALTLQ
jgi:hypothetical protein